MFDESKHKRKPKGSSEGGRFTKTSDGAGGEHEETPAETERLKAHGIDGGISLSRQEYAVLRAEVMRKNAAQRGKVKPTDFAYTANFFYIYGTNGDDDFMPFLQLSIDGNEDLIRFIEDIVRREK